MSRLIEGSVRGLAVLCPNCRTVAQHKVIVVTDVLRILWCERCRVPHLDESNRVPEQASPPGAAV